MNPATRALIEASLKVRSIADTHALLARSLSEHISMRSVINIRREMNTRDMEYVSVSKSGIPLSGVVEAQGNRSAAEKGCKRLQEAMECYYERRARSAGVSVDGARLAVLYSHEELQRMASVGRLKGVELI